jgi:hypothetical protein
MPGRGDVHWDQLSNDGDVARFSSNVVRRVQTSAPDLHLSGLAPTSVSVPTPVRRATVGSIRPVKRGTYPGRAGDPKTAVIITRTLASMRTHGDPASEYVVRNTIP